MIRKIKRETIRILRVQYFGEDIKYEMAICRYNSRNPVLEKREFILEEDGSWAAGKPKLYNLSDVEHIIAHRYTIMELMGGSSDEPSQKPLPPVKDTTDNSKTERVVRAPLKVGDQVRAMVGIELGKRLWTNGEITKIASSGKIHVSCPDGNKLRLSPNEVKHKQRKLA